MNKREELLQPPRLVQGAFFGPFKRSQTAQREQRVQLMYTKLGIPGNKSQI